jgi:hypothetical protein
MYSNEINGRTIGWVEGETNIHIHTEYFLTSKATFPMVVLATVLISKSNDIIIISSDDEGVKEDK